MGHRAWGGVFQSPVTPSTAGVAVQQLVRWLQGRAILRAPTTPQTRCMMMMRPLMMMMASPADNPVASPLLTSSACMLAVAEPVEQTVISLVIILHSFVILLGLLLGVIEAGSLKQGSHAVKETTSSDRRATAAPNTSCGG